MVLARGIGQPGPPCEVAVLQPHGATRVLDQEGATRLHLGVLSPEDEPPQDHGLVLREPGDAGASADDRRGAGHPDEGQALPADVEGPEVSLPQDQGRSLGGGVDGLLEVEEGASLLVLEHQDVCLGGGLERRKGEQEKRSKELHGLGPG